MSNELILYDFSRKISDAMDYRLYMEKSLIQDSTNAINNLIREKTDQIMKTNAVIGAAQINAINNQTSIINLGFDRIEYRLGELGASFRAGAMAIIDATFKMSEEICDRLDTIADIASNPRRTEAREFYRDGARNYLKGFYEEARDFLRQALEKDKTDYRSWYLLGIMYLRGKGEYSDVINLDDAIIALTNAIKYFSPEIAEYKAPFIKERKGSVIINSYNYGKKVAVINEVREITSLGLKEAKDLVESTDSGKKATIAMDISEEMSQKLINQLVSAGASAESYFASYVDYNDINNPKFIAAEIVFYLGQAKRFKSNELASVGKLDDAKIFLIDAQKDYEKSLSYSDKMLEAQYNIARCKALLGDTDGALADLISLIIKDNAYMIKIELESDFDVIRETYYKRREEVQRRIIEEKRKVETESEMKKFAKHCGNCNDCIPKNWYNIPNVYWCNKKNKAFETE